MSFFNLKFRCRKCGKEFRESDAKEWLDEFGEEDTDGEMPCCPYCGSDDVDDA